MNNNSSNFFRIDWKSALWSGFATGVIFLVVELFLVAIAVNSPWGPVRMIGAIMLGQDVLPPPAEYDLGVFMAALVVHFPLSLIYAFILAFFINSFGIELSLTIGTIFGLLLYIVNFYPMTTFFPWFQNGRGGINIFTHIVFGVVAAWTYKHSQKRH